MVSLSGSEILYTPGVCFSTHTIISCPGYPNQIKLKLESLEKKFYSIHTNSNSKPAKFLVLSVFNLVPWRYLPFCQKSKFFVTKMLRLIGYGNGTVDSSNEMRLVPVRLFLRKCCSYSRTKITLMNRFQMCCIR